MNKQSKVGDKTKKTKEPLNAKKAPTFCDLVGSSAGKATVEEVNKMLDEMRAEDDD